MRKQNIYKKILDRDPPTLKQSKEFSREAAQKGDCELPVLPIKKKKKELP